MTKKITKQLIFILILTIAYAAPYYLIYQMIFWPWDNFLGVANIKYFIFQAWLPAYIILYVTKLFLNKNKKFFLIPMILNYLLSFFIILLADIMINPVTGYTEFLFSHLVPALIFWVFLPLFVFKWSLLSSKNIK